MAMLLSDTVTEISGLKCFGGHGLKFMESRDVIGGHVTVRLGVGSFL